MSLSDLTEPAVLRAVEECERLGEAEFLRRHGYGPARAYFLVIGERSYPSKAIAGVAHGYVGPGLGVLESDEFVGGDSTVRRHLERLGFTVEVKRPAPAVAWDLIPDEEIRRKELHDRYGGGRQGGIAPCAVSKNVLVFTSPDSGNQHGYFDRWEGDDFMYCGEGQAGDQQLSHGNAAILNHRKDGRALRLFEGARGTVRYIGEFELDLNDPYTWETSPATGGGADRKVVMFRLHPLERAWIPQRGRERSRLSEPYRTQDESVATKARDDVRIDPDRVDRGLRAHRALQNELAEWARSHGFTPISPARGEPEFDVGWWQDDVFTVVEVKSLGESGLPTVSQLRLGLGQVLDYQFSLIAKGYDVRAVLAVEHDPGQYWTDLCSSQDVIVVWAGALDGLR